MKKCNKKMKLFFTISVLSCILGFQNISLANYNIDAVFNKEYTIIYNEEQKDFFNANGILVYPVFHDGTNYLPIRAVSSLFNVPIKWDGNNNTIYLGNGDVDVGASKTQTYSNKEKNEPINALVNEEIKVIYDGKIQNFYRQVGDTKERVYPVSYEGTTYLPIRNITELFDGLIEWDGTNKTIKITSKEYLTQKNENKETPVYNIGDDYIYNNGDLYFRIYEAEDFEKDFIGGMYHEYKNLPGDRAIAKIANSIGSTNVEVLFKNDSRGKFYLVDNKFFFSNDKEIYATDLKGNRLTSFGKGSFKELDADNHKLKIYKENGIYEINTLNLQESKKTELYYEYTLDKIKEEFFETNLRLIDIYKDEEKNYYYFVKNNQFEIYCFNYLTKENKKICSIDRKLIIDDEYLEDMTGIDFITQYKDKIYLYYNRYEGGVGTSSGQICCVDEDGNVKILLKTSYNYVDYDIKDKLVYLCISNPVDDTQNYIIHLDTMNLTTLEGDIFEVEKDKNAKKADDLINRCFNTEFKNKILSEFNAEDTRQKLNNEYYTGTASYVEKRENIWEENVFEPTYTYKCGNMFIYEYNIAAHGWISWRGEYYRTGVIYFLVDTERNIISKIYRVKL